jgi:hypothetical protein
MRFDREGNGKGNGRGVKGRGRKERRLIVSCNFILTTWQLS